MKRCYDQDFESIVLRNYLRAQKEEAEAMEKKAQETAKEAERFKKDVDAKNKEVRLSPAPSVEPCDHILLSRAPCIAADHP